jgi:Tol biopolymer transport system component
MSADGRYVAYITNDNGVVPADTNGYADLFVRDTCRGASSCTPSSIPITVKPDGTFPQSNELYLAHTSSTMRYVVFFGSSELVPGLPQNAFVVRDTCIGATNCTPSSYQGSPTFVNQFQPFQVSDDGRYVVFVSTTAYLSADTNNTLDVYVYDTCHGASACTPGTTLVSVTASGTAGSDASSRPSISSSGRYIAFESSAVNLVAGDTNSRLDIFVRDTCAGAPMPCTPTTVRASVDDAGTAGGLDSVYPHIDGTGRFVAFQSDSRLALDDTDNSRDVYVRDTCIGAATCTPATRLVSAGAVSPGLVQGGAISDGGRYVLFSATGSVSQRTEAMVRDTCIGVASCTPSVHAVSHPQSGTANNNVGSLVGMTPDGRFVAFDSHATNLVTGDTNGRVDVFLAGTGF